MTPGPEGFIRSHLRLAPVPGLGDIRLYAAHAGSRLSQLAAGAPPYWAYAWAGGLALARHFRANPQLVAGRALLDLGAGSGLVGIVAARLGARVYAAEIDPHGRAAIALNAAANGVEIAIVETDLGTPPAGIEIVAAGDVFYNPAVAETMLPFLRRCAAAGLEVLVGDPVRRDLPQDALVALAEYGVRDMGDRAERRGVVYAVSSPLLAG